MSSSFGIRSSVATAAGCLALVLASVPGAFAQMTSGPGDGPISPAAPKGPVVARGSFSFGQVAAFKLPVLRFASLSRVPAGRRLVIEQVSIRVETEDQGDDTPRFLSATLTADVESTHGDTTTRWEHFVSASPSGSFAGRVQFTSVEAVRYYAFAGERLSLRARLDRPTPSGATATYTVTGYLE